MSNLAPCPGCGQIETLIVWRHSDYAALYSVSCRDCGWRGPCLGTAEAAAKHWNRRAPALRWRREPPDVPGWWWVRWQIGGLRETRVGRYSAEDCGALRSCAPNDERCLWAGPIPEPAEPEA